MVYLLDRNFLWDLRIPSPPRLDRVATRGGVVSLESWVEQVAQSFPILPMDATCFREWGRLMSSQPDHLLEDGMIAATARVHGLTIATRNERDFRRLGVDLVNPFRT